MQRAPLSRLKAEASALAGVLGNLSTRARAASAANMGSAGRRRSGTGENFWQYRRFGSGDGADRIDWRRSAREENLFIRETELETARTFLFWVDPGESFAWASDETKHSKQDRAMVVVMALATALSRAGERCGALGGGRGPISGPRAAARVGEDCRELQTHAFPAPPKDAAAVVIASDFYEPLEVWRSRLAPLAGRSRDGALLAVADPVEETYPFDGRVRFFRPGETSDRLIGRAESVREEYLERFAQRRRDLTSLATQLGWRLVVHSTAQEARIPLGELAFGFSPSGTAS